MGTSSEITRGKVETEHWRLACLVLKHQNNELMMDSSQAKNRFEEEEGFEEGIEISQKHDDPNVTVYNRKNCADTMEMENDHWRLACLVLKHHNNELMMECSQLKKKYEKGFKEGIEISRKDDDPSVIIYKREKCTDVLEDDQRGKCQKCAELKREIEDLKLMKKRDAAEIEDLRVNCMEMDIEVTALSNHEIDLEKELEAYKIKCQGLSAELQRKGTELENLA
ncbi:hypothetical protein MKW92_025635, partial [Papaver armeniacum]